MNWRVNKCGCLFSVLWASVFRTSEFDTPLRR
ncbi:unnamed protein product [Spirodela intermedia]|uniref:Uncharacterized protein n=1 Tax=Spirodela intermedia TaxID=51605 RepID=A0A7I8L0J7_SPIIN|nr:unnamed protein product [Spirodela intermedia]